ncbi:MAG: peptide chain release factor 2, partial [Bacteroidota bacterium]
MRWGGIFDVAGKRATIEEKEAITRQPDFWENPPEAQKILKEISSIKIWTDAFQLVEDKVGEVEVLYEFQKEGEADEEEVNEAYGIAIESLEKLE